MRILGVDPGSRVTGYGIIDVQARHSAVIVAGVVRPPDKTPAARLGAIHRALAQLIAQHCPTVMAIERVFVARNAASAIMLGQARGAVLATAGSAGLEVVEYSASQIKLAVVGSGRASKEQVRHMVGILLSMNADNRALDTTDALAAAICHGNTHNLAERTGLPAGARWGRR